MFQFTEKERADIRKVYGDLQKYFRENPPTRHATIFALIQVLADCIAGAVDDYEDVVAACDFVSQMLEQAIDDRADFGIQKTQQMIRDVLERRVV